MTQQPSQPSQQPAHTFVPRTPTPRIQTPRPQTPSPTLVQGPPPVNNNKKPDNRRKGKSELYTDQFGNACNADLSVGANWFIKAVQTVPDIQIHYWCNVINAGNWGYLNDKGFPSRCLPDLEISCKRNFILLSIMRAFDSQSGCHKFLIPPKTESTLPTRTKCAISIPGLSSAELEKTLRFTKEESPLHITQGGPQNMSRFFWI